MKKLPTYIAIFCLILSFFYFAKHLRADEIDYEIEYQMWRYLELDHVPRAKKLTTRESMDYHGLMAAICMKELEKEIYWYLPSCSNLDKAKKLYATAIAGIAPADPRAKAAAMFLCLLGQYGFDVMDSYHQMVNLTEQAKHHYEMYTFYAGLVAQGK